MKKLKIFLLLSILLCFGFALSPEVHAQGAGPKAFEIDDIIPANTIVRISWTNLIRGSYFSPDGTYRIRGTYNSEYYSLIYIQSGSSGISRFYINTKNTGTIDIINAATGGYNNFISPYTQYGGVHAYCDIRIDVPIIISQVDDKMNIFTWELLGDPILQGYNVTFEENGGSDQTDLSNVTALPNPLPIPTKENHTFLGWYYNSAFTQIANAGDPIESDVTLYAKWELNAPKPFEIGDVLPAGNIKISWDFTGKPIPDKAVTFMVKSGDDYYNDFIIQIDFNFGGYNHLKIFNGGSVEHFNVDTPGFTIITLTESVTITDLKGTDGITSLDYNVYIGDALTWEVISQDYLDGFTDAREIYGFRYMGGPWMSGAAAWNHGYDLGSEEAWEEGFEYGMEIYGYYDPITDQWLSVTEYINLYGTDKMNQSDFYNNFDKYFIPAMIIVFGGAIVLTILKVFKGRD